MRRLSLTLICAASITAAPVSAQFGPDAATLIAAQRQAMARIARFDGIWRGSAWTILSNGTRHDITQTERIGPMLDGSIKVIEGRGYEADGRTGFNAFGIISYDQSKTSYTLHSYAQGYAGDFELKLNDTGYTWEIPAGPVRIRYTATVTDSTWLEVGDRLMPGRPAVRFFEMSLKRIGSTSWPAAGGVSQTGHDGLEAQLLSTSRELLEALLRAFPQLDKR